MKSMIYKYNTDFYYPNKECERKMRKLLASALVKHSYYFSYAESY